MLTTRDATYEDAKLYYDWANDPISRANSFGQDIIQWDIHIDWFQRKLKSSLSYLYVVELNERPIGQVRFDITDDVAEIGYSIDAKFRKMNYGYQSLDAAIIQLRKDNTSIKYLIGKVKKQNVPSIKIFTKLGFTNATEEINTDMLVFKKHLTSVHTARCGLQIIFKNSQEYNTDD